MSWLSVFWKKNTTQAFVGFIIQAAKLFLGKVVNEVYTVVREEVYKSEMIGGDGWLKWNTAFKGIRDRVKNDIPEFVLSILIEGAVAELKALKPTR